MHNEKISPAAKAIVRGYIRNDGITLEGLKAIQSPAPELVEAIAFIEGCSGVKYCPEAAERARAMQQEARDRREQSREEEREYFASGNADSDRDSKRFGGAW